MEALVQASPTANERAHPAALVFVGFMGAGKSRAALTAAEALEVEALDSDRALEHELGEPLERFFDREGEEAFRAREEEVVLRMLERPDARVVAIGGGAVESPRVRDALVRHTVVHLEIGAEEAWRRSAGTGRPLARDRARFERLHRKRAELYEAVGDATLPAGDPGLPRRALGALLALREARGSEGSGRWRAEDEPPARRGPRLLWAVSGSGGYPVFFGRGLVAGDFFHPRGPRRFAVTDENVHRHHRIRANWEVAIPAGEPEKTLARAESILREMARAGVARDDLVAAVGGGVVGDLAGFCAAVYQRGIAHVQVPTTLLAQVDSAYGGKTAVDLPEAKNYVGAYHAPAAVLVDPAVLGSLPDRELAAGYAEVLKTALIAGGPLWERVRSRGEADDETILACARTKLAIVAEDERDGDRRQVLNLGHTVAHAIEAATGYGRYRHGEALAIGLLCALRLSGREGLRGEVAELLAARGLPLRLEGATPDAVARLVARDKKRRGGRVPFVLVEAPGAVTPGHEVGAQELRAALEEVAS